MQDQRDYWNAVAEEKTFTHPVNLAWLARHVPPAGRVLDYGCGYGRALHDLAAAGYHTCCGVDFAPAMIARGRRLYPGLDLRTIEEARLGAAEFDAILLLAVLTCIPEDSAQAALMAELHRLLRPGGVLLLSDMPLQDDARNRDRYAAARFGTYGVFETSDGAVVHHHSAARLRDLLAEFETLETQTVALHTMNGHAATGVQILARRP